MEAIRRRLGGGVLRNWPYLVATIAVLVAFRATLTGDGHIPYDLELYHFPLLYSVQDQLASGSFPAWDPYTYAGMPLLGNTQAAWAYPPHLILDGVLALADRPLSQRALQCVAVFHVWLAAAGTVLLVRERGLGDAGAAFAGVFAVLCGATVSQAQHLGMTETLAWLPLALVVVERMRDGVTPGGMVLLGSLFALMLMAGFLPLFVACVALVVAYAVARGPNRRRTLAGAAAGTALGIGLSAVVLVPVLPLLSHFPELDRHGSLPAGSLVTALIPNAFGHWLDGAASYSGIGGLTASYYYVGAGALVLLPLALARGRGALADAAIAAAFVLLAVGTVAASVAEVVQELPGGPVYRPEMFVYVASIPLALLLAHGLRTTPSARQLAVLAVFLGVLAVVPLSGAAGATLHLLPDAPRRTLLTIAVLCGLLVLALALARRPRHRRWAGVVLGAVAVIAAIELTSTVPDRYFIVAPSPPTSADAGRVAEGTNAVGFLQRALKPGERIAADTFNLPAEWAGFSPVWRLENVNGFHPQFSEYLLARVRRTGSDFRGQKRILPVTPSESSVFRELGVRYVVVSASADEFAARRGYSRAFADPIYRVYRVRGRQSRAYLVDPPCVASDPAGGLADCATAPVPTATPDENERNFQLGARTGSGPQLLITGEPHYPGWHAEADGRQAPVRRIDYLTGVEVPPGASRVTLRYRPPLLWLGACLSLLSFLGAAVVVAIGWRRRRALGESKYG